MVNILSMGNLLYGAPSLQLNTKLWNLLLQKYVSVKNVANRFKISERQLYKWKELVNNYPLNTLNVLVKDVGLDLNNNLNYIKTRRASEHLNNPKNNITIPSFILQNNDEKILWKYLVAAYGCDGTKDRVSIVSASSVIDKPSNLTKDLFNIFRKLNFISAKIRLLNIYKLKNEDMHSGWVVQITDKKEKNYFLLVYHNYLQTIIPTAKDRE